MTFVSPWWNKGFYVMCTKASEGEREGQRHLEKGKSVAKRAGERKKDRMRPTETCSVSVSDLVFYHAATESRIVCILTLYIDFIPQSSR